MLKRRRQRHRITFAVIVSLIGLLAVVVIPLIQVLSAPDPLKYMPAYLRSEARQFGTLLSTTGYWYTAKFHGRYYNINANGERRVLGQPIRFAHTLWLFGNSGTFDPFVPDSATMASDLQLLLDRAGYTMRVVNRSAGGQKISGELAWLKDSPVQPGDVVVFIDGAMNLDTPERNASLIASARAYSRHIGATFYRFVQPSITPLPGGIDVPASGFVEGVHMNAYGDVITARWIFDALTLI